MSSRGWWRWLTDPYLRPTQFLDARHAQSLRATEWALAALAGTVTTLTANFLVYAMPVVALWSARSSVGFAGAVLALGAPFLYLTGVTALGFHAALVVTGNARTLTASVRSVVVAVSVYLGVGLGFAFPYLAGSQTELGRLLRHATMLAFTFGGGESVGTPAPLDIALGIVGVAYFALALYLLARLAYAASRRAALFVTLLTVGTPLVVAPLLYAGPSAGPVYLALAPLYAAVLAGAPPLALLRRVRFHS